MLTFFNQSADASATIPSKGIFAVNETEYSASAAISDIIEVDSKIMAGYDECCMTVISFSEARSAVKILIFSERIDAPAFSVPSTIKLLVEALPPIRSVDIQPLSVSYSSLHSILASSCTSTGEPASETRILSETSSKVPVTCSSLLQDMTDVSMTAAATLMIFPNFSISVISIEECLSCI